MSGGLHTWHIKAAGRVQGVYYRAFVRQTAIVAGATGYVQNEVDGNVTAVLQHTDEHTLALVVAQMTKGPPGSRVDKIEREVLQTEELHSGFTINY